MPQAFDSVSESLSSDGVCEDHVTKIPRRSPGAHIRCRDSLLEGFVFEQTQI